MVVIYCPFCSSEQVHLMMGDIFKCPACCTLVKIWEIDTDKLVELEEEMLFPADYLKSVAADLLDVGTDRLKGGA